MAFTYTMLSALPWAVVDTERKRKARHDLLPGARLFDEYQDRVLRDQDQGTVEEWDLIATWAINSNVDLDVGVAWVERFRAEHPGGFRDLHPEFASPRADLLRIPENELGRVGRDLDALTARWFKLSSVTKTLAARRPNAIPILDSVVSWMLAGSTPNVGAASLLPAFAEAASAFKDTAEPHLVSDAVRQTEKLLWFDGLFPAVGGSAVGTATRLVTDGWRLVVWPVKADRGSAGVLRGQPVDGCVAQLSSPAATATIGWTQLTTDDRARLEKQLAAAGYPDDRRPT